MYVKICKSSHIDHCIQETATMCRKTHRAATVLRLAHSELEAKCFGNLQLTDPPGHSGVGFPAIVDHLGMRN